MNDLILQDISRCNNHRCLKRVSCARYMQLEIDFKKYRTEKNLLIGSPVAEKVWATIPVSRFAEDKHGVCEFFILIN